MGVIHESASSQNQLASRESRPRNAFKVKDEQSSKKDRVIKKDFIDAGHSNTSDVHVLPRRTSLKRKEPHDGFDQDDNVRRVIACHTINFLT